MKNKYKIGLLSLIFLAIALLSMSFASAEDCIINSQTIDFSVLTWNQVTNYVNNNKVLDAQDRAYIDLPLACAKGLKRELDWRGESLSSLPVNWAYHKPSERLYVDVTERQLSDYLLKLDGLKNMSFEKDGETIFRIVSTQDVYQIDDITLSNEWGYHGEGYGVDIIYSNKKLIQKGQYICVDEPVVKGSGISKSTYYDDCLYYPQVWNNATNETEVLFSVEYDSAMIIYPLPYDPLTSNFSSGLTNYWSLENNGNDETGNSDVTPTNSPTFNTSCIQGGCYDFDGSNDFLTTNYHSSWGSITDDLTINVWVLPDALSGEQSIIDTRKSFGSDGYQIRTNGGNIEVIYQDGTERKNTYSASLSIGQWYMITFVVELPYSRIYLNGVSVDNQTFYAGSIGTDVNAKLRIGDTGEMVSVPSAYNWVGLIDEVSIWNTVLNDSQINELYNGGSGVNYTTILNSPEESCSPSWTNTTPVNTFNSSCLVNDFLNSTWNWTEYDANDCNGSTNTSFSVVNQTYTCDFCTPSALNTSLVFNTTIGCMINDTRNDSYYLTEYDSNGCYAVTGLASDNFTNTTYDVYVYNVTCDFCTPSAINSTPINTYNSSCGIDNWINSTWNWTEYDANGCYAVTGLPADIFSNTTFGVVNQTYSCVYDSNPPVISGVSVDGVSTVQANISWTTNESANSSIYYGTTLSLGSSSGSGSLTTSHSLTLNSLSSSTLYYFKVGSCDVSGNCANSSISNFTTNAVSNESGFISFKAYEVVTGDELSGVTFYVTNGTENGVQDVSSYTNYSTSRSTLSWTNIDNAFDLDNSTYAIEQTPYFGLGGSMRLGKDLSNEYVGQVFVKASSYVDGCGGWVPDHTFTVKYVNGSGTQTLASGSCTGVAGGTCTANIEGYYWINDTISRIYAQEGTNGCDDVNNLVVYELSFQSYDEVSGASANLSVGDYTVKSVKNPYYDKSKYFSVVDETPKTVSILDVFDTYLSINLHDVITKNLISVDSFATITDFGGYEETFNSSNGAFTIPFLSGSYGFSLWAEDYAYYYVNSTVTSPTDELNASLYANNSVVVNVYDIATGNPLDNYTITLYSNATVYQNVSPVGNYTLYLSDILSGEYVVTVERDGYSTGEYVLTMTGGSYQFFNAYLFTGDDTVIFTIKDIETSGVIEGATVGMYASLNNTWTAVNVQQSDVTGRVQYPYISGTQYKFVVVKEGYESRTFFLKPIFETYTVRLTPDTETDPDINIGNWVYYINNSGFFIANVLNEYTISILSGVGSIEYYYLNVSYPDGYFEELNCSNSAGCTHDLSRNITGFAFNDTVKVSYTVKETGYANKSFSHIYLLQESYNDGTLANWDVDASNVGDLEKALIATLIFIVVVGAVAGISVLVGAPPITISGLVLIALAYILAGDSVDLIPMIGAHIIAVGCGLIIFFGKGEI